MNKTLFKTNFKLNRGILAFITAALLIYVTTSVSMFDPESAKTMESMLELLPEGMAKAFGFENFGTDLTQYLGNYLYGFIFIIFPMIYTVIVSNKLIAKHVDSGSMAYLLSTPNSRIRVAVTQAVFLLSGLAIIYIIELGVLIGMSEAMFPGKLDIGSLSALTLVTYLSLAVTAGIGFFFSCLFNDTKNSIALGGGIPGILFVLKMVSGISEELDFLRYFTVFSFIDVERILNNNSYALTASLILAGMCILIYTVSIIMFNRRSLPI